MHCFIYKSLKKDELYLYLDKKDDFSAVPESLLQSFGRLAFVMDLQLSQQLKLAREDVAKVIDSIRNKGFFIQMPPVVIPSALAEKGRQLH